MGLDATTLIRRTRERLSRQRALLAAHSVALILLVAAAGTVLGGKGEARAAECFTLSFASQPESTAIWSYSGSNCPGGFLPGTTVTVGVGGTLGWRFLSHTGGGTQTGPNTIVIVMDSNKTLTAQMAMVLQSDQATQYEFVSAGGWRYYVIDVPPGATTLSVFMNGTGDADLYTRFGQKPLPGANPGPDTFLCRPFLGGSNEHCIHNAPAGGTWYIGVNAFLDAEFSLQATISACWPVTRDSLPAGFAPSISPAENCAGGYTHGTAVTLTPVTSVPNPFTHWGGGRGTASPLVFNVTSATTITANHAMSLAEGAPRNNQLVAEDNYRYFYADIPAGKKTAKFSVTRPSGTGGVEYYAHPDGAPGTGLCDDAYSYDDVNTKCVVPNPAAGRTWLKVFGTANTTFNASLSHCVEVSFTTSPPGSGTIVPDPAFDCAGGYANVNEFFAEAVPDEGYTFAGFTPANITTSNLFQVTGEDIIQTANFAKMLQSGFEQAVPDPLNQGRFYHFVTHDGDERIEVTKSGPISATLWYHNQFGQPHCEVLANEPCVMDDPYVGNWWVWVERTGAGDASITATITTPPTCYPLTIEVNPPEGGTVQATPSGSDGCPQGSYLAGTEIIVHSTPNAGFVLAEAVNSGINQDYVFTVTAQTFMRANFAVPLTDGIEEFFSGVAHGETRTGYIDVPPGTASIQANFSALTDGFQAYLYPPELSPSCSMAEYSPPNQCAVNSPVAGRWWLSLFSYNGDNEPPTDTLSIKATLDDEPICWSITATAFPPGSYTDEPRVVPEPNCADGKYLHGTRVEVIPGATTTPDYSPSFYQRNPVGFNREPQEVVLGDTEITVHYAQRLLPGTTPGLEFHDGGFQAYLVDLPSGVDSLLVDAVGLSGLRMDVGQSFSYCDTNIVPLTCEVTSPQSGRWYIAFVGEQQGTTDITITLSPAIAATISAVTPDVVYFGQAEPVQLTVQGFGFDPGEVVYFGGTALATQFVSANQLTATLPVNLLPAQAAYIDVWVGAPPEQTLRDVELPSNSARILHTRPSSDVNCDGDLTSVDALDLLRAIAGLPDIMLCFQDVNLDSVVSLADAIRLRQEIAGLAGPLPMPLLP